MLIQEKQMIHSVTSLSDDEILNLASRILFRRFKSLGVISEPLNAVEFLRFQLGRHEREVFGVLYLKSNLKIIGFQELFYGTINNIAIYPREVVKGALRANAAKVILAHNHPSGSCEVSHADRQITQRLINALALVDIAVLDHLIVGKDYFSFAEHGLINVINEDFDVPK